MNDDREIGLDPTDWNAFEALGQRMVHDLRRQWETVRERPVWRPVDPALRAALAAAPVPEEGQSADAVYDEFARTVARYPLGNTHPRFWGWVVGSGSPGGALADLLASAMNPNASGLRSAAIDVEEQVLRWFGDLFDLPGASGLLTSGGSMANLLGMAVGLDARAGFDVATEGLHAAPQPLTLYASRDTHSSVDKAARLLGLGTRALRKIATDGNGRIDVAALTDAIRADRAAGCRPFLLIGNAGTVGIGATDPLDRLADVAAEEGMWFHVDGAFGAFAWLVESLRPALAGLQRADSLAFDPHKWLHAPMEAGCLLVRDRAAHRRAFAVEAPYLKSIAGTAGEDGQRFADVGIQLTRGFRALKLWFELKHHGLGVYRRLVAQNVAQARRLAERVRGEPELELMAPVPLNVVCLRYRPMGIPDSELDALNVALLQRLHQSGVAVPSATTLAGGLALRVCITNHRTRRADVDQFVDAVLEEGRALGRARLTGVAVA